MKIKLLLLFTLITSGLFAQTSPDYNSLPSGFVPYGSQYYKNSAGIVMIGTSAGKFRVVTNKYSLDSLAKSLGKNYWLYVMAGESNAAGAVLNTTLTPADTITRRTVFILNNNTKRFERLKIGTNNNILVNQPTHYGWELQLSKSSTTDTIYIVKTAFGGSTIEASIATADTMRLRIDTALAQLRAKNINPVPVIMYSQGINNSPSNYQATTLWKDRTLSYMKMIRDRVGYAPFFMTKFPGTLAGSFINGSIDSIASYHDNFTYTINTDDAPIGGNGPNHWNRAGDSIIVKRMLSSIRANVGVIKGYETIYSAKAGTQKYFRGNILRSDSLVTSNLVMTNDLITNGNSRNSKDNSYHAFGATNTFAFIKPSGSNVYGIYSSGQPFNLYQANTPNVLNTTANTLKLSIDNTGDLVNSAGLLATEGRGIGFTNRDVMFVKRSGLPTVVMAQSTSDIRMGHINAAPLSNANISSGTFTQDFIISPAGNLGIGTMATPLQKLHVDGNITLPADNRTISLGNGNIIGISKKAGSGAKFAVGSGTDLTFAYGNTTDLQTTTTFTDLLKIAISDKSADFYGNLRTPGNILVNNENRMVSIGTSAVGNSTFGLVKTAGISGRLAYADNGSFRLSQSNNSGSIDPATVTYTDRLVVDAVGNMGVGVSSPTARLTLSAGNASLYGAPLKFLSGPLLTAPEIGAFEFNNDRLYFTKTTTTARETIAYISDVANVANYTASGNGSATTIVIPHGLTGVSTISAVTVSARNAASAGISYVTSDATNISIVYTVAPASGTNNLSYTINIKP